MDDPHSFWDAAIEQLPALAIFAAVTVFVVVRFLAFLVAGAKASKEEREKMLASLTTIEDRCHSMVRELSSDRDRSAEETRGVIRETNVVLGEVREALRRSAG